ncbi:MAG: hypoxanthine phosphoribosyltransferase [Elusimicrobiota bacterium]
MKTIKDDIQEILVSEDEIRSKIADMGKQISEEYRDKDPVLISILKGSIVFLADLMKVLDTGCSVDFVAVSSYAGETESSGIVRMIMDLRESIEDRHVLLVEDIVDTGLTISYLKENMLTRKPKSFKICTLLYKPVNPGLRSELDYVGFEIPNKFVVGYGLDYMERYRNLPYVGVLKPEVYRNRT